MILIWHLICRFAKRFGFLEQGKDIRGIMRGLDGFLLYAASVGMIPEIHNFISKLLRLIGFDGFGHIIKVRIPLYCE